jgi:hypothetical protein
MATHPIYLKGTNLQSYDKQGNFELKEQMK